MKWSRTMKKLDELSVHEGTEEDDIFGALGAAAARAKTKGLPIAWVTTDISQALDHGFVKCGLSVSVSCPQTEEYINATAGACLRRSIERANEWFDDQGVSAHLRGIAKRGWEQQALQKLRKLGTERGAAGNQADPFRELARQASKKKGGAATVRETHSRCLPFGELKCGFTLSVGSPQTDAYIAETSRVCLAKAVEIVGAGFRIMGVRLEPLRGTEPTQSAAEPKKTGAKAGNRSAA